MKPQPAGGETEGGNQTKQGTPKPQARASEAHDPDPSPRKQTEESGEGTRPTGHGEAGKETHTELGAEEQAPTTATDRRANEPAPRPKEEA